MKQGSVRVRALGEAGFAVREAPRGEKGACPLPSGGASRRFPKRSASHSARQRALPV